MEDNQVCQVIGCEWPVVLCPELCAPHWWKLTRPTRHAISRAQVAGQKAANHPSVAYQVLISDALRSLNASQGSLAVYVREDGDRDARLSALTTCATCQRRTVHHAVIRSPDTLLVCSECQSITPSIERTLPMLPGMEVSP